MIGLLDPFMTDAQDPIFSLPFVQKLYINPAFAGAGNGQVGMGFRNQFPGNPARYITSMVSWDQAIDFIHGGVGVTLMHDKAGQGTFSNTSLSALYSYHLRISGNLFLNSGFQFSLYQNYLNTGDLILPDMISPAQGVVYPSDELILSEKKIFPDFSVGFLLFGKNWFSSLSACHLMEPYQSSTKTDMTILHKKYSFLFGYVMEQNHKNNTSIYSWAGMFQQGISHQGLIGLQMKYYIVAGGISWKKIFGNHSDIVVFSLGFVTQRLKISYSYDAYVGRIHASPSGGAHEIGLNIQLGHEKNTEGNETINWPIF